MSLETVVRTADLPARERFDFWREMISQMVVPVELRTEAATLFDATIRMVDIGGIQASLLRLPQLESIRTPRLIRRSDPEIYYFAVGLRGTPHLSQRGREVTLGPGQMVMYDSSHPHHATAGDLVEHAELLLMHVPRALFPLPVTVVEPLLVRRMPAQQGIGALTTGYLDDLVQHAADYTPADAERLLVVTMDLIAALLAHELDTERRLPPETRQRSLLARIHAYIQRHLADPHLSPDTIAAAHNISLRSLHRLFDTQHKTIAAWIRTQRLERCRHDLIDPARPDLPVHAIASRWGFPSHAHFTRAFRAAYGVSPLEYRRQTLTPDHPGTHRQGPGTR